MTCLITFNLHLQIFLSIFLIVIHQSASSVSCYSVTRSVSSVGQGRAQAQRVVDVHCTSGILLSQVEGQPKSEASWEWAETYDSMTKSLSTGRPAERLSMRTLRLFEKIKKRWLNPPLLKISSKKLKEGGLGVKSTETWNLVAMTHKTLD
jgi:hypothetical protein